MKDKNSICRIEGDPRVLGVTKLDRGYNFAIALEKEEPVSLLLYKKGTEELQEEIAIPAEWHTGQVAAVCLPDFSPEKYEYNYKVGEKIFQDPEASIICGKGDFGELCDCKKTHSVRCGFLPTKEFDWEGDRQLELPYSEMILYKLHVRGFTKQKNSKVRHKGTFTGITEKIPYFKELGITALELMPAYDFDEVLMPDNMPLEYACKMKDKFRVNYWGYTSGNYFAPKSAYCSSKDHVTEVKNMVKELHKAGIQCIMEFYFPEKISPLHVLNIIRYWYLEYHMDGFHLLGDGVPSDMISSDPLLKKAKLMFQSVPCREDSGCADKNLAEYNEGFKQDMRRFLKSDEDSLDSAVMRMRCNPENHAVVNYIANQDGFTLMDLVSYDAKHNEANGEENRDGNSFNYSWNCGVEGPSRKLAIRRLREKQMRNGILFMLLSQGVPMIYAGDEFGNSQQGNNNAYCQDNEIGWVDWRAYGRNGEMVRFVKDAIEFRKKHGVFHQSKELRVMDYQSLGYPDVSYHSSRAWYAAYDNVCRHVGLMYCGDYAKDSNGDSDDFIYVAYNFHWEPHEFALPNLPGKQKWCCILETGQKLGDSYFHKEGKLLENQKVVEVAPRSIGIFIGKQETSINASLETLQNNNETQDNGDEVLLSGGTVQAGPAT